MSVKPVSLVKFGVNNQLGFEGKKKDKQFSNRISIPARERLAVPLAATVLAMSPMSSLPAHSSEMIDNTNNIEAVDNINDNKNEKIVATKDFYKRTGEYNWRRQVQLINTKGTDDGFDKINIHTFPIDDRLMSYEGDKEITQLNNINFEIKSSDGSTAKTFNIKSVSEGYHFSKPGEPNEFESYLPKDVMDYVYSALTSDDYKGKDIIKNYKRTLRVAFPAYKLQNVADSAIYSAVPEKYFGKPAGSNVVELKGGKYTLRYYSTDDNLDNAEVMTVQKEGCPELRLWFLASIGCDINRKTPDPRKINLVMTVVGDAKNDPYFYIDEELTNLLYNVYKNHEGFKNLDVTVDVLDNQVYGTTAKGVLMPYDLY